MSTVPNKKAALVTVRELQPLVEKAVREAGVHVEGAGSLVLRWDLIGRILRDHATADKFAVSVAKSINAQGHDVVPAVLHIDKTILAGFYERVNIPQLREF